MDMKRFFLYAIVIAALVMAGCGGNGGGGMTGGNGDNGGTTPPPPAAGPTVQELFETALDAEYDADAAVMAATAAVTAADEAAGMLTVDAVRGDSMMAQMNAQEVLDSNVAVGVAVTTAKNALAAAEQAGTDADDHNNDTLDRAIAAAITVAEKAVMEAEAQANRDELEDAVEAVIGDNEDDPMTPADHAAMVAMAIDDALDATSATDGSGMRVTFQTAIDTTELVVTEPDYRPAGEAAYEENDHVGETWEMIVGEDNVSDMTIATSATATAEVKAAKFGGMPLASLASGHGLTTSSENLAGTQYASLTDGTGGYKGIPGTVFCGGDCTVEGETGSETLTGDWYFTPTTPTEWYVASTVDDDGIVTAYAAETQYARYGYWVARDATSGDATVNVYAIAGAAGTTTDFDVATVNVAPETTLLDTEATYSGEAVGLSVYKEFNADATLVDGFPQSGEFTADVNLTATFGTTATLGGKITNFEGDAVDSAWEVTLGNASFDGTLVEADNAVALGIGETQGGIWTGTAYGSSNTERPEGIFGHFNAHFTNGSAAGAYATQKD